MPAGVQAAIPPLMAPAMQAQASAQVEAQESKSLIGKLLKRTPKPAAALADNLNTDMPSAPASDSLFNWNFLVGLVVGVGIGAIALPIILNILGGSSSPSQQASLQAPVQTSAPVYDAAPTYENRSNSNGDTFIDNAVAEDVPQN